MTERKRGRPKGSPATTNKARNPLLHTGTGRQHSLLDYAQNFNRTKTESGGRRPPTEDHLHMDCFSVMKVVEQRLLIKEVSAITEAISLFLNLRAEMTPIESIYLTFKDSILMSCGAKPSDLMIILSPDTIAKPLGEAPKHAPRAGTQQMGEQNA